METKDLDLCILKTIVTNKKYAVEFAHDANEKLFVPDSWFFAKSVLDYIRTYKDVPTKRVLLEKVAKNKNDSKYTAINTVWEKLDALQYDEKEFKHDLEKLKNRYANSTLNSIQEKMASFQGAYDVQKVITELQSGIQNIKGLFTTKKYEQKTLKDALQDFRNKYAAKKENPDFGRGILTGYGFFDYVLNGLRPAEMLLIGAESGGGKSMLLMNMAIQMWMQNNKIDYTSHFGQGYNVVYFSLEMPFDDCLERILARNAMVPQKSLRDASLGEEELARMKVSTNFIEKYPYHFEIVDIPRGATVEALEIIYNEIKTRYTPDIVVVDYLGLMDYDGPEQDDWLKLGKIAEKLHEFGRVHNVVTLSAVQLTDIKRNGKGKDSGMQVGMHRVGRSSLILHNANFAIQIEKRDNEDQYPDMNLHLIKSRRTELVKGVLNKNFSCCALLDNISGPTNHNSNPEDISDRLANVLGTK